MDLKQLLFGGGAKTPAAEPFRDSIQAWLPIKNIVGGVVVTKDGRFIKILEVLPVNIYLKSPNDRENIISSYAAWLKIAPDDLQIEARTLPADTADYVERMKEFAAHEPNQSCREMIEDNIKEIGQGVASDALRHRFFLTRRSSPCPIWGRICRTMRRSPCRWICRGRCGTATNTPSRFCRRC